METKRIHLSQLFLDSENPRHDTIENQRDIIEMLVKTEKIDKLAKDIAEQGTLSPLESVGVIPLQESGDEYVVVEGNRRVCACMLLHNPDLCSKKKFRKKFEELSKKNSIPNILECKIFSSRDDADHWIQLRHEGQQDGVGTKQWDTLQVTRYAEKRGRKNRNIQAQKLLEFAIQEQIISPDDEKKYAITTLQRYLGNPHVRNVFGLENKEDLKSKHEKEVFVRLVSRFLKDCEPDASGNAVINSRSKSADWQEYANILQREITDPPLKDDPVTDYGNSSPEETPPRASEQGKFNPRRANEPLDQKINKPNETEPKKSQKRQKLDPAKRKYLIPNNTKFSIADRTLNRVYHELRRLQVDGYEFSVAYLMRAFIENSVLLYMREHLHDDFQKEEKLNQRIGKICDHLSKNGVKTGQLSSLRVAASEKNSMLSPFILGAMVHLSVIPTKRELISIWDRLETTLKIIHDRIS